MINYYLQSFNNCRGLIRTECWGNIETKFITTVSQDRQVGTASDAGTGPTIQKEYQQQVQRIAKLTIAAAFLAVSALFLGACASGGGADAKDSTVAATVNGKKIMFAEVEQGVARQAGGKQSTLSQLEMAQARLQMLGQLNSERSAVSARRERESCCRPRIRSPLSSTSKSRKAA